MSYGYLVQKNLTNYFLYDVLDGFNSNGTTSSNFINMGSFTSPTCNFKKQNPLNFIMSNGIDVGTIYEAKFVYCLGGQSITMNIPSFCKRLRLLICAGGGSGGGALTSFLYNTPGGNGGGGGAICSDYNITTETSFTMICGSGGASSGGGNSSPNDGVAGNNSTFTLNNGTQFISYGGHNGGSGNKNGYYNGSGGGVTTASNTDSPYNFAQPGLNSNGGYDNYANSYSNNNFDQNLHYGNGGSGGSNSNGEAGTDGFTSVHFLY